MYKNKKGYVTLYVAGLLGLVLLLELIMFIPLSNQRVMIRDNIKDLENFYREQAALERLASTFAENISYSKDTVFDDLKLEYKIEDIDSQQENVVIETDTSYRETEVSFYINNHTSININVKCGSIIGIGLCRINIYAPSGERIISVVAMTNRNFEVSEVYNPATDTWGYGYGNYVVRVTPFLSYVSISVNYNKIARRTVKVTSSENKKYIFTIINNESEPNLVTRTLFNE